MNFRIYYEEESDFLLNIIIHIKLHIYNEIIVDAFINFLEMKIDLLINCKLCKEIFSEIYSIIFFNHLKAKKKVPPKKKATSNLRQ